jgi:uncharacterized protein (DUF1778 family)
MAKKQVGLRLDEELRAMAEKVAKIENRTLTNLIETALKKHCERVLARAEREDGEP